MTRIIKASEVKPGMTIRWETQMEIKSTTEFNGVGGVLISGDNRITEYLASDALVTVVSEPTPPQPEEPTEFGAKVRVRDGRFVRLEEVEVRGALVWFEEGTGYRWTWDDLCEMGPVTVVPDQGWTVPADTPEVPDRIEEWPEDDTALRKHRWKNDWGDTWTWITAYSEWECRNFLGEYQNSLVRPSSGPWTRA